MLGDSKTDDKQSPSLLVDSSSVSSLRHARYCRKPNDYADGGTRNGERNVVSRGPEIRRWRSSVRAKLRGSEKTATTRPRERSSRHVEPTLRGTTADSEI